MQWSVALVSDPAITAIVRRCYIDAEVHDRQGNPGRGFTNLKQIYGRPDDLRHVVGSLARTVGEADAVASTDEGSAPLAALVAYSLSLPAVFVRSGPKTHGVSYGGDPATDDPRLSGDRLVDGTVVHVVDDFVHSGATLAYAVETLRDAGFSVSTAAALLGSPPASIEDAVAAMRVQLTILLRSDQLHIE